MTGVGWAGVLTAGLAAAIIVPVIVCLKQPATARLLLWAGVIVLPLQPLVFFGVRLPIHDWLSHWLGPDSSWLAWLMTAYAPLTEEPAKLVPLLIPAVRRELRRENVVRYALTIGLAFAVGEMGLVAWKISQQPQFAGLAFWQFGGYISERLLTCAFHSLFVAVALWHWRQNFVWGVALAMLLHWLANFPIALMQWNVGGLGQPVWQSIVAIYLIAGALYCIAGLAYFAVGSFSVGRAIYGRRQCPECQQIYDAPLFAVNFGMTRYEPCPHCRRWHWTRRYSEAPLASETP